MFVYVCMCINTLWSLLHEQIHVKKSRQQRPDIKIGHSPVIDLVTAISPKTNFPKD